MTIENFENPQSQFFFSRLKMENFGSFVLPEEEN